MAPAAGFCRPPKPLLSGSPQRSVTASLIAVSPTGHRKMDKTLLHSCATLLASLSERERLGVRRGIGAGRVRAIDAEPPYGHRRPEVQSASPEPTTVDCRGAAFGSGTGKMRLTPFPQYLVPGTARAARVHASPGVRSAPARPRLSTIMLYHKGHKDTVGPGTSPS
jgi:hypothetical protein